MIISKYFDYYPYINVFIYIIYLFVGKRWFMYKNRALTLRKLVIRIPPQIASFSYCEKNWSTFALIHTKQ